MSKAPIALTCGEPAGIGPELAMKCRQALKDELDFVYIGDPDHVAPLGPVQVISDPGDASRVMADALPVLAHGFDGPRVDGVPNPAHAKDVIAVIEKSVALVKSGAASAVTTLPIHKEALQSGAGFAFPGHTEFLAKLCERDHVVMMLAAPELRVVPVTIHIPLSDVPSVLTGELLKDTIEITRAALISDFGLSNPRFTVAGLNPHAGEGGRMGREEIDIITPALDALRQTGIQINGPVSADTMFHPRARESYDVAICMYHDQALIPIKTVDFDRGVNVTLGLPIVRTSPDHGTGFDIAGRGIANATSTITALRMADQMARQRQNA